MKNCFKSHFLLWLLILYPIIEVYGQARPAEVDSTFESYIRAAWNEVTESGFSDSLQNQYAKEFLNYYLEKKESKTADDALTSAFMMWGNTGEDRHLKDALQAISFDSGVWQQIIVQIGNIYFRSDHLEYEQYIDLLLYLENQLTDSKSVSAIYSRLIRYYNDADEIDLVIVYARKLVELDADEWYVNLGLGFLHEIDSLQIGQRSPSFSATTLDGETLTLSDLDGKFAILEFWGTWCGPCIPEIPHLKTLWERHGEDNLVIVGIALDDNEEVVNRFIEEREMPWPQILQTDEFSGELVELFNVVGVPRMYLIDTDGIIIAKDLRGEEMVAEVDRLISEYFE